MNTNPDKLTPSQDRAILALLSSESIEDAARIAKVAPSTLFRWLKDEGFDRAYLEARRKTTAQAIAQLQQVGSEAVKTLRDVMKDANATPGARVTAAKAVLEMSMKSIELEDPALRVTELEKHIEGGKK